MKQRYSSLDIKVISRELEESLLGLRLSNIYNLSSKTFLFKFVKPDHRQSMLVESGYRCHLTEFSRTTTGAPSGFVAKLRKSLRSRRVSSVSQIGTDRVIDIQFSDGQYHLFLEFFAGGNVILTDAQLLVGQILRPILTGVEEQHLNIGSTYSLEQRQNYLGIPPLTRERVLTGLQLAAEKGHGASKKPDLQLRKALATSLTELPPVLIDHVLLVADFPAATTVEQVCADENLLNRLVQAMQEAVSIFDDISKSAVCPGFIIARKPKPYNAQVNTGEESTQEPLYEQFHPFEPKQYTQSTDMIILKYDSFNKAVDKYFSSTEIQKLDSRLTEKEEHAKQKLENAKKKHNERVDGLQQIQESNIQKAQAIEANVDQVADAIAAVNTLIAQSMDWHDIAELIKVEQNRHNDVAMTIRLPLKLQENKITLTLPGENFIDQADFAGDETESEDETDVASDQKGSAVDNGHLIVDVDLSLSPWSNARQYYDQKKVAVQKEQKTLQASSKALKSTEKKIRADLQKGLKAEKDALRPQRKIFWFEKFFYFISSDGYLVLGAKDAQQSDALYSTYLNLRDVHVCADVDKASFVVVKNNSRNASDPIPPNTLSQAGFLSVATSSAWESKAIITPWWVTAQQVSKTPPGQDILLSGAFHISGEKSYLPPTQLVLGFGLLFHVSKNSGEYVPEQRSPNLETSQESRSARLEDVPDHSKASIIVPNHVHEGDRRTGLGGQKSLSSDSDRTAKGNKMPQRRDSTNATSLESHIDMMKIGNDGKNTYEASDHVGSESEIEDDVVSEASDENMNIAEGLESRDSVAKEATTHVPSTETIMPQISSDIPKDREKPQNQAPKPSQKDISNKPAMPQSSGAHGKQKKAKLRYKEQDEEDRKLAMKLLGASSQKPAAVKIPMAATAEQESAAQREKKAKQRLLLIAKAKQAEEKRQLKFASSGPASGEEDEELFRNLSGFVGDVKSGDHITAALVMCGPWSAISSRCKFKAKLQPGIIKKGKAVRQILQTWSEQPAPKVLERSEGDMGPPESSASQDQQKALIKDLRETEVVGTIPVSRIRIVSGADEKGSSKKRGHGKTKGGKK